MRMYRNYIMATVRYIPFVLGLSNQILLRVPDGFLLPCIQEARFWTTKERS